MSNVIPLKKQGERFVVYKETPISQRDDEYGLCPVCRKPGRFMNCWNDHFRICEKDKTCWFIGSLLISNKLWSPEAEEAFAKNYEILRTEYTPVRPASPRQDWVEDEEEWFEMWTSGWGITRN